MTVFEQSTKDLYKTVKAPESLKKRIEQMAYDVSRQSFSEPKRKPVLPAQPSFWRTKLVPAAYTLAACAAAVTVFFASQKPSPDVPLLLVGHENPAQGAVTIAPQAAASSMRLAPGPQEQLHAEAFSLVLTLDTSRPTEISVSHGSIADMLEGESRDTLVFSEDAKICWYLEELAPDQTAVLRLKDAENDRVFSEYALTKEKESGQWTLCRLPVPEP